MNFGPQHYVPVLKIKRGEKLALGRITPSIRPRIIPLLEVVERKADRADTVDKHLTTTFKDLADSLRLYPRCFLDTFETADDGPNTSKEVFHRASCEGIAFTPVTGISRSVDVAAALDHQKNGVALRLTRDEFESAKSEPGRLEQNLTHFMDQCGLVPDQTDLIVDLGDINDLIIEGVIQLTREILREILIEASYPLRWRTLTVSASAFPLSMGVVNRHSHKLVQRDDWIAWRRGAYEQQSTLQRLPRLPTFSDRAIQHPKGVEGFDPRTMQVSASIRYATVNPESWLLIKGESTRTRPAGEQFPDLATQLVHGYLRSHFRGENHCEGCASIVAAANNGRGLGSAEAWRRIGTIHHLTTVIGSLDALLWT